MSAGFGRRRGLAGAAAALALASARARGQAAAGPAQRDTLTVGIGSYPSTFHPLIDPESVKSYILGFASRPLTSYDPSWTLAPVMAQTVPTLENGMARREGDGMSVTLRFRPGLAWGDGAPVGAADLAFTAQVGRDPNSGFANTDTWARITAVDVVDALTATVHFREPTYLYNQFDLLLPSHLEGPVYAAANGPGDYIRRSLYNRAPTTPGLFNGPYLVTEVQAGASVLLGRNPHWPGPAPAFRQIAIRTIGNTAALQANLLSGDVDLIPGEGIGLTLDQVLSVQAQEPERFAYLYKPNLAYTHIDVQLSNPILADLRVRRALLHGIDRASLVAKTMGGRVPVADSFVSPLEAGYTPDVPKYPFDPARARALLDEAGWAPGPDGIRRNAAGDRLSIVFSTSTGVRVRELQQQVMQSQWRNLGVETVIRNEPPRTLFGEDLKHRTFPGLAMFGWVSPVNSSPRQILSSKQIPTEANNWGGTNYTGWSNATMDADIDTFERELDPQKQLAIRADMQRIYAEQLPVLPLFFGSEAHVLPLWLRGVTPTGTTTPTSQAVETWTVA